LKTTSKMEIKSLVALCSLFVLCSAATYHEKLTTCKTQYGQTDDVALDYFLAHGEFQAGKENLKCFFQCLATELGAVDETGALNKEKLPSIADTYPDGKADLQIFSNPDIISACWPKHQETTGDACNKIYEFVKCGVLANLARKAGSS